MKYYGAYDVAVLNDDQKIGAITTDDLLDIYRDEAVEDIEKLSLLPWIQMLRPMYLIVRLEDYLG